MFVRVCLQSSCNEQNDEWKVVHHRTSKGRRAAAGVDRQAEALQRKAKDLEKIYMGRPNGLRMLFGASIKSIPGNNRCLFGAIAAGLGGGVNTESLLEQVINWQKQNEKTKLNGEKLSTWVCSILTRDGSARERAVGIGNS